MSNTAGWVAHPARATVAHLEAALKTPTVKRNALAILPSVVEGYLKGLRGSLGRNPERARELLAKLLGPIACGATVTGLQPR